MQIDWLWKKISFSPYIIGLVVFDGKDQETGIDKHHDALASSFHKEKNLKYWEAVGAVPPTYVCLKS